MIICLRFLNISLSSQILVFLAVFVKHLKSETHLRNAEANKASFVNKGIGKICLLMDMVRKNWSWIVVASCGLHYFVSACFVSFWIFANFITVERFKYLFFTATKILIMVCIVKKQTNFIFSSVATWTCQMSFTSIVGYGIIAQAPLFNLC